MSPNRTRGRTVAQERDPPVAGETPIPVQRTRCPLSQFFNGRDARCPSFRRQDGGSPYGCDPHRNRMHGGVVLFASLKAVW